MKKVIALILAGTILFSSGCASMNRNERAAVGAAVIIGAVATVLILGSQNKNKHHHHKRHHDRGCRCNQCHHR